MVKTPDIEVFAKFIAYLVKEPLEETPVAAI